MKKKTQTQNMNVACIGHPRAGKTCLMRQLLRQHIPPGGPVPTELVELLTKRLRYKLEKSAEEREDLDKRTKSELCRLQLRSLRKKQEDDDPSDADSNGKPFSIIYQRNTSQQNTTEDQAKSIDDINIDDDSIDDSSWAYVTLFDFGGDEVFRMNHQCIMSANKIYLLVFDVSLWENQTERDHIAAEIEYWLNLVATYAGDESDERKGIPPIILIGSHMDKIPKYHRELDLPPLSDSWCCPSPASWMSQCCRATYYDEKDICIKIWNELQERLPGMKDILKHHVKQIFLIADMDNSDLNEEKYLDVWCEIEKYVDLQSCWHDSITGTWLAMEEKVMLEKEKGQKFLNIQQILDINSKLLVPLAENELVPFLRYMHNAGSIICFDIFGKMDSESEQDTNQIKVILDINWIIKAFATIITDEKFADLNGNKQQIIWEQYKTTAMLTDEVLELQWRNVTYEDREVLISQMKNLGLITERTHQGYMVPCLLSEAKSDCIRQLFNNESVHSTKTLCLVFRDQFIQESIWDRTVAFCLHEFGECTYPERGNEIHPKRGFICRNVDDIWNFVLHCKGAMLKMTMFNHHEQPVPRGVGDNLRLKIEGIIKTVLSMANQEQRKFYYYLHCDFWIYDGESDIGKPKIETLMRCTKFPVKDSKGNKCFLTQNDCHAWFGDVSKVSAEEKFTDMTRVKIIHAAMVTNLHGWVYPTSKNTWGTFQTQLDPFLANADLYDVPDNSMAKICKALMRDGHIDYGDYSILREIVNSIHVKAADVIDKAMVELSKYRR
ncbi:uncharacterized protein LOC110464138 [Mizuhopecten yessoensis]|uniref:Serine/threonine-protein kinase roco5 n=1 Tax=Mizuhopecten yessoensis TaxID=6573 RepID=A0A210PUN9_MIZYE|nr:uncharacterized protein LOC110464138 [Mizuhopecten yessoensis]OWF40172.1 serine/threonine-protein kinase roco5 [Mizuhopecten yessoensis]